MSRLCVKRTTHLICWSRYSGEEYVWCIQLFEKLSLGIELVDSDCAETLVTPGLADALRRDLKRRITRNTKRQTSEIKKKEGLFH